MRTVKSLYLLLGLVCLIVGCESEKSKQARLAKNEVRKQAIERQIQVIERQIVEKQRQGKELEQKIEGLKKVIAGRTSQWRESVTARHSEWSHERRKQQMDILVHKWTGSNCTKDEDTVREMRTFAWRWYSLGGIPVDLVDEDYWDIARAESAKWGTYDQIKELRKHLEDISSGIQSLQRQLQVQGPG